MKKTFKGWLFNRIEIIGDKKYNHVGCEGENKDFGDFLSQFVPDVGMRRKVEFTIEAQEEPKVIEEYRRNQKERKIRENNEIISKKELNNTIDTFNVILKWNPDPKGYFIIKPIPSQKKVFVRYYNSYNSKHILKHTFAGTSILQIMQSIIKRKLISRLDHAAYLGKEIEKAIIALKNNLNYIQDKELNLNK